MKFQQGFAGAVSRGWSGSDPNSSPGVGCSKRHGRNCTGSAQGATAANLALPAIGEKKPIMTASLPRIARHRTGAPGDEVAQVIVAGLIHFGDDALPAQPPLIQQRHPVGKWCAPRSCHG